MVRSTVKNCTGFIAPFSKSTLLTKPECAGRCEKSAGIPPAAKLSSEIIVMNLWSLFLNHQGRIIHKWVHYFPIYERHFQRYVNRPMTLIEIGCGEGGSLQLWKQYFGPYARIVGLDIRPECKNFEEDQIHVRIGDQSDEGFLSSVIREFGPAQIILDDGSHQMTHIVTSFRSLYPTMAADGVYLVEDLHTAYWDEYGGGLRKPGSFVELCKDLIDELNAEHTRGLVGETDFSKATLSMHFYDSIVAFERGKYGRKYAPQIGKAANPS
jgi:cephalosporin hydroxylase